MKNIFLKRNSFINYAQEQKKCKDTQKSVVHRTSAWEVVGKSCNRTGPDRSAGNYRSSPTDNYGQLRIPILGFSADTGSHQMNVVNTQPTH